MFTYKFLINTKNRLIIRLRCDIAKAEVNTKVPMTEQELRAALRDIASNSTQGDIHHKTLIARYTSVLNLIMIKFIEDDNLNPDIETVRDTVLEKLGLATRTIKGEFLKWFERFTATKTNPGTKSVYQHTLSKMSAFDSNLIRRKFKDINLAWLEDFEAFCAQTATKNARNIHLRNIRAVFNYAIDHEATACYPFRRFKIRPEPTAKRSLSLIELRTLFDYEVDEYAAIYRDMFKLIFMLIGINTVDLYRLTEIKNGRINYRRAKTGRLYTIKVEPEALELINKYKGENALLNIADRWHDHRNFARQCNTALQRIGSYERKGRGGKKIITPAFPGITTYWARHTWATIAYSIGISKDIIAQALGHSDGYDTTNIYIKEDPKKVDEANRRVLDWVLYDKN